VKYIRVGTKPTIGLTLKREGTRQKYPRDIHICTCTYIYLDVYICNIRKRSVKYMSSRTCSSCYISIHLYIYTSMYKSTYGGISDVILTSFLSFAQVLLDPAGDRRFCSNSNVLHLHVYDALYLYV